jgi:hypothetical protein
MPETTLKKHNCGVCQKGFDTEQEYLDHECTTGFTPKDIEHQDALTNGQFSEQAEQALRRGAERNSEQ